MSETDPPPQAAAMPRPWRLAFLWLVLLGPFFFVSYGFANSYAAQRPAVGSVIFAWEHAVPFLPWTIIPYWIIDLMYGISLFLCKTKDELTNHGKRLLTAQIIAVACFTLFPLRYGFERPATDGIAGYLFERLTDFDKPFNQAPSLHIALLVLLWVVYQRHLPRLYHWPLHALCALIGVSVLTTYQHHFVDIPTGLLLGWFCFWLWPDGVRPPSWRVTPPADPRRWRIAFYYLVASALVAAIALRLGGTSLWLLWLSVSLLLVASFYVLFGSRGFQKARNGIISPAARWLLWPYLLGARINSRWWTRHDDPIAPVVDDVWIGRFPSSRELASHPFQSVVDLTAEFSAPQTRLHWASVPSLDLLTPDETVLLEAAKLIAERQQHGPVLVTCALGYSRSALAIATWLLVTERATTIAAAIAHIRDARPQIVISPAAQQAVETCAQRQRTVTR